MNKTAILSVALVAAFAIGCESMRHGDDHDDAVETMIQMDQVPAGVRQAFEREFPGAQVREIEKEVYSNGTVHYGFEFVSKDGKKMEAEFSEDGELLPEH